MKRIVLFLLLLILCQELVSCNERDHEVYFDDISMKNMITKTPSTLEWFTFDSIIKDDAWRYNENIQERVEKLQIPKEQLAVMPVDTLLDRCIRYPFYYDYTAANDVEQGIKAVMACFNGFFELYKRQEVASSLIKRYKEESIIYLEEQLRVSEVENYSMILREYYLELIISQYLIGFTEEELVTLESLFNQKTNEKVNNPDVFGGLSRQVGEVLQKKIQERYSQFGSGLREETRSMNEIIYTTFGKSLVASTQSELLSTVEILALNLEHTLQHPAATLLSSSTSTYNCHSYAWHMSEGGATRWIDGSLYGQPTLDGTVDSYHDNIEAYWTDGLYAPTTFSNKEKIYYYRGDHSASVSTVTGKYESKWGCGPLMRHSPTDCPSIYYASYQSYYHPCNLILQCSAGIGTVLVNQSCTYSAIDIPLGISSSYSWSVIDPKGEETIGVHAIVQNSTGASAQITFNQTGTYEITLTRYHPYRGTMYYTYEALVTN